MRTIEVDDLTVTFSDDQEVKDAVFEQVVKFFSDHRMFSGEGIGQDDNSQMDAPWFLGRLADDILKFTTQDKFRRD